MPASYTNGHPHRHPTCWALSQRSFTSLARCAMEPGHLLHSALTAKQLICSSDNNVRSVALWVDPRHRHPPSFIPDTGTHPLSSPTPAPTLLEWPFWEQRGSGLTASAAIPDVSALACTNGVWPPMQPVSVVQNNKSSTMLSSNLQFIDLPIDCTAWRLWMMRHWNGCSISAREM